MGLPGLASSQMVEVDRIMMVELEVPVDLMMEHAGNNLARLCVTLSPTRDGVFRVIAGSGNNGGGGTGCRILGIDNKCRRTRQEKDTGDGFRFRY